MVVTHPICAARTIHDLACRLRLTIPEKLALLFDAGTFVEESAPDPALDPRHGERRLVTGHGQMNQHLVAAALFDSSIAAGAVTVSTGKKLIAHMQRAEEARG
jgi:acetyl-CoA carboxylase carboxyltransferase component